MFFEVFFKLPTNCTFLPMKYMASFLKVANLTSFSGNHKKSFFSFSHFLILLMINWTEKEENCTKTRDLDYCCLNLDCDDNELNSLSHSTNLFALSLHRETNITATIHVRTRSLLLLFNPSNLSNFSNLSNNSNPKISLYEKLFSVQKGMALPMLPPCDSCRNGTSEC